MYVNAPFCEAGERLCFQQFKYVEYVKFDTVLIVTSQTFEFENRSVLDFKVTFSALR